MKAASLASRQGDLFAPRLAPAPAPAPSPEEGTEPFLKWVGSKRWLVEKAPHLLPTPLPGRRVGIPFMGGGSVVLHYAGQGARVMISDANERLVNTFRAVRDDVEAVIVECDKLAAAGYGLETYRRALAVVNGGEGAAPARAAAFIAVNRWGFNGVWRVNKRGLCNMPIGAPSKAGTVPRLIDPANLRACSRAIRDASIDRLDFAEHVEQMAPEEGDILYFDPPYVPKTETSSFTIYTSDGFTEADQERLVDVLLKLDRKGVRWAASNSDTPITRTLYTKPGWEITSLKRGGGISCKTDGRQAVGEILVRNFGSEASAA